MTEIRCARAGDVPAIAAFTAHTFDWGDYVAGALPAWLDDPAAAVYVAVDERDEPIGMARGTLLSPHEAWFHAARVHPDHRRRGIAGLLAGALLEWARAQGALVGRLLVEDWNEPSRQMVTQAGMRSVARFLRASRAVGEASVRPEGNGGRRRGRPARTRLAHRAEAAAAYASWSIGPLGLAARNLFPHEWTFRRLRPDDLVDAATRSAFWEVGSGWALIEADERTVEVDWLETSEEEAEAASWGIVGLATETGREEAVIWVPDVDWAVRAVRRAGCEVRGMEVFAIDLDQPPS